MTVFGIKIFPTEVLVLMERISAPQSVRFPDRTGQKFPSRPLKAHLDLSRLLLVPSHAKNEIFGKPFITFITFTRETRRGENRCDLCHMRSFYQFSSSP